jgi:hypothetical protein
MAQQVIGVGTTANDGTGDALRDAMVKTNDNFTELYAKDVILEGGGISNYVSATSTYTLTTTDYTVNCTTNSFTVTLPTAVGIAGKIYVIKNSGTGTITVDGNGTQTIDGSLTAVLSIQYESITIQSTGTNFIII